MKKKVVAVFEDDVVNRFIYDKLFRLRKQEVEFHIFDSVEKGITKSKEIKFDVVLIEIHFWENFGGISILKKLKETCSPTMTSIAMTSLLQEGDLERIMDAGFTLCLEKPTVLSDVEFSKLI